MSRSLHFKTLRKWLRITGQQSRSIRGDVATEKNEVDGDACPQIPDSQHGMQRAGFPCYSDRGNHQPMYQCPNWPATNVVVLDRLQLISNPFNQISCLPWDSFFWWGADLKSWITISFPQPFLWVLNNIREKWKVPNITSDTYLVLNKLFVKLWHIY